MVKSECIKKHGSHVFNRICVWAPSKIVLDAVDGPSAKGADAVALASWFAADVEAYEMLVIGEEVRANKSINLRSIPVSQVKL